MKLKWKSLLIYIPVFVILVEVLDHFTNDMLSFVRAGTLLLIVFIFFATFKKKKFDIVSKIIVIFLIYSLFIVNNSSDIVASMMSYLSIFVSLSFYVISYNVFKFNEDIYLLNKIYLLIAFLFAFNVILYSGLRIGRPAYEGILYFGKLHHNVIYTGPLIIISAIVFYKYLDKKLLHICAIAILTIVIILSFRRTAIILIAIGFLLYIVISNKKEVLKLGLPLVAILILSFPYYGETFFEIREARGVRATMELGVDRESRYREMALISDRSFSFNDKLYSLTGTEFLNSEGTYATQEYLVPSTRPLHTDYALILHGAGIIGLIIYFLLLVTICGKSFIVSKKLGFKNSKAIMLIIMASFLVLLTFSGSILSIGFRTSYFILLGMIMGISDNEIKMRRFQNEK